MGEAREKDSISDSRQPGTGSTARLRTTNEISAAELVKRLHEAVDFKITRQLIPENFPPDMAGRDFLECLNMYRKMWIEANVHDVPYEEWVAHIDAERLAQVAALKLKERLVCLRAIAGMSDRQIADDLTPKNGESGEIVDEEMVNAALKKAFKTFGIHQREDLHQYLPHLLRLTRFES